jgi:hypothetical protein
MEAAVRERDPDLVVCTFLKKMIPESIWTTRRCLIVHPGPRGDRGPSSVDWAIELRPRRWLVTVLEANGEFDTGEVWATRSFAMREVGKSSLYRHGGYVSRSPAAPQWLQMLVLSRSATSARQMFGPPRTMRSGATGANAERVRVTNRLVNR